MNARAVRRCHVKVTSRGVGLLARLVLLGAPGPAVAHGILLDSKPKAGETTPLGVSPVELGFNVRIEQGLSRLRLTGPSGQDVPLPGGPAKSAGLAQLTVALPPLAPGLYTVHWRIFTRDGHLSHGRFSFQVSGRE